MRATWVILGLVLGVLLAVIAAGLAAAGDYRLAVPAGLAAAWLIFTPVLIQPDRVTPLLEEHEAAEGQKPPLAGRRDMILPHYTPAAYDPSSASWEPRSATVRLLPLAGHATLERDGYDCSCGDCMAREHYWPRKSSPYPPAVGTGGRRQRVTEGRTMHDYSHAMSVPGCQYCEADQQERGQW